VTFLRVKEKEGGMEAGMEKNKSIGLKQRKRATKHPFGQEFLEKERPDQERQNREMEEGKRDVVR